MHILKRTVPYVLSSAAVMFGIGNISNSGNRVGKYASPDTQFIAEIRPAPKTPLVLDFVSDTNKDTDSSAVSATAARYDVIYTRANGNQFRRSGGTRAWRNNNPGCLRYSEFTVTQGAIGHAGGFAVFPDDSTGMQAICALLKSDSYRDLTISQAIFKYAPPHENDTENYNASLWKITGLNTATKLSALTDEQIMRVARAIRVVEGWAPGRETYIYVAPKQVPSRDTIDFYAALQNQIVQKQFERVI